MNFIKENHNWINTGLIILVAILVLVGNNQPVPSEDLKGITNYDSLTLGEDLIVTGVTTLTGAIQADGMLTISPTATATTTTGTSATLLETDLTGVGYHSVTLGGAQDTDFTYTLPATTTLTSFIDGVGERAKVCWFNIASSTSIHTLIFAAGTGIDIRHASTTNDGLSAPIAIGAEEDFEVCFDFMRQPDEKGNAGDVTAILETFTETD